MYTTFLPYSSVLGHTGGFHSLALVGNAAVSMNVQVSLCFVDIEFFG